MKKRTARTSVFKKNESLCDWKAKPSAAKVSDKSLIHKRQMGRYTWKGVNTEAYKAGKGDWNRIIRRTLVGEGVKSKSHLRYFEIAPGGQSSLEKHRHEHIVIGIRGKGKVLLDKKQRTVTILDVVYISPNTPHQFSNPFNEPFGFFCVVTARRDRPKVLSKRS
jgi:ribulose-bisphosphate carboxylase large chain